MMTLSGHRELGGESGAVAVTVAILIPLLLLMASFVIDVGNWFGQQRHLQMQADSGALAGAQEFGFPCSDTTIKARAMQYSGVVGSGYSSTYNDLGTPQASIKEVFNQRTFADGAQADTVDTTNYSSNPASSPCADGLVDVKIQEQNPSWFFQSLFGIGSIGAHARAALMQVSSQVNEMPLGVPENSPRFGEVFYFDESTGTQIATGPIKYSGTDLAGQIVWDNSTYVDPSNSRVGLAVDLAQAAVFAGTNARGIGTRVAFTNSPTNNLTGVMATDCGSSPPTNVTCFDDGGSTGLLHLRAFTKNGTGSSTAPIFRDVQLLANPAGCGDQYFANVTSGATCAVNIQAGIDFGGNAPGNTTVTATNPTNGQSVTLQQVFGASCQLQLAPTCWSGSGLALSSGVGMQSLTLTIRNNKATTTVTGAQRAYTANSAGSGPILSAFDQEPGVSGGVDANSFECDTASCVHNLVTSIHMVPSYTVSSSLSDPAVLLRSSGNGAQTQVLECWTGSNNFKTQLISGCPEDYAPNTGNAACPAQSPAAPPYQCVQSASGAPDSIVDALDQRIEGSATQCPAPNNWGSGSTSLQQIAQSHDPRKAFVLVTPFGSLAGSNSTKYYPVLQLAEFYITYWQGTTGGAHPDPCGNDPTGDGTYTTSNPYYNGPLQEGDILGHFIKYVQLVPTRPAGGACNLNAISECGIYMTQ